MFDSWRCFDIIITTVTTSLPLMINALYTETCMVHAYGTKCFFIDFKQSSLQIVYFSCIFHHAVLFHIFSCIFSRPYISGSATCRLLLCMPKGSDRPVCWHSVCVCQEAVVVCTKCTYRPKNFAMCGQYCSIAWSMRCVNK